MTYTQRTDDWYVLLYQLGARFPVAAQVLLELGHSYGWYAEHIHGLRNRKWDKYLYELTQAAY